MNNDVQAVKKELSAVIRSSLTIKASFTLAIAKRDDGIVCVINVRKIEESSNFASLKEELRVIVKGFHNFGFFAGYDCNLCDEKSAPKNDNNIAEILNKAKQAAKKAALKCLAENGQHGACGFAWVHVDGVKSTKIRNAMYAAGFRKPFGRSGIQLWNPAGMPVQSVAILEAGADAYAAVLRENGFNAYANSRLD